MMGLLRLRYRYGDRGRLWAIGFRNAAAGLVVLLIVNVAVRWMA